MQQEMKSFFAVALLTVFGILMTNNLVLATPVAEWGLAGGLFVLAALFVVWASLPERAEASTDLALNEDIAPKAQEWIISKDVLPDGTKRVQLVGNEALPFDTLAESEANA
ncbi:MAG: hypothetical protein SFZ02_11170 [bacterium]|nr:hypothetical protein [bacterium]